VREVKCLKTDQCGPVRQGRSGNTLPTGQCGLGRHKILWILSGNMITCAVLILFSLRSINFNSFFLQKTVISFGSDLIIIMHDSEIIFFHLKLPIRS